MSNPVISIPLNILDGLVDRVLVVIGGLLLAQLPGFINVYEQRLQGHVDEAALNVASWQIIADKTTNGRLDLLTEYYLASEKPQIHEAGQKLANDRQRLTRLRDAYASLQSASVWQRPWVFLSVVDMDMARATASDFTPALPINLEAGLYALLGVVVALAIYQGSKRGIVSSVHAIRARIHRAKTARRTKPAAPPANRRPPSS